MVDPVQCLDWIELNMFILQRLDSFTTVIMDDLLHRGERLNALLRLNYRNTVFISFKCRFISDKFNQRYGSNSNETGSRSTFKHNLPFAHPI